jgi:hypothetical protein
MPPRARNSKITEEGHRKCVSWSRFQPLIYKKEGMNDQRLFLIQLWEGLKSFTALENLILKQLLGVNNHIIINRGGTAA